MQQYNYESHASFAGWEVGVKVASHKKLNISKQGEV